MYAKTVLAATSAKSSAPKPVKSWLGNFLDKLYALCAEPLIMGLFSGIGYHGSKLVYELVYSRIAPPSPSARSVQSLRCSALVAVPEPHALTASAAAPPLPLRSPIARCVWHRIEARANGEPAALRTVRS